MDLRQLNALLAVADQGSFTAAADALATVQSNVSAHIARLEREVGSVLVDRSTGQLTEEGEAVAARARRRSLGHARPARARRAGRARAPAAAARDVVPRRARSGRPTSGDHPHPSGRARRGTAHRLAHLRRVRAGDPPCHRRAGVSPAGVAAGAGLWDPATTNRRGPAEPGPAVGSSPGAVGDPARRRDRGRQHPRRAARRARSAPRPVVPYGWRNPPAPAGGEQNQGRGVTGVKGGSRTGRQQAVSRRLAFLLAASQSVAARLDEDDALDAFARIAVTAMADLCIIDVRDVDGGLRRAAVAHADRDVEASVREALRRWPPDPTGRHPAAEALRTGQTQRADELPPGLLDTPTPDPDAARLLPELGLCSYLAVPLTARGHTLGTVLLSGTTGRAFGPDDVDVAEDVAQLAALAVDNARLVADERAAREGAEAARARVSLLAEATSVLTETLDPNAALERLAELLVPGLADWCRVDLCDEEIGVRRAAMTHVDPATAAAVSAVEEGVPVDPTGDAPVARVLRSGRPLLLAETSDDVLVASARTQDQLDVYRSLGLRSLLVVPLVARGDVLGTLTLGSAVSGRRFDDDDVALGRHLGRRAGLAIDNARMYD